MEGKNEFQVLLERLENSNQKQVLYAKLQCLFSAVAALCCVGVLLMALGLMPRINGMMTQITTILTNVESVSATLAQADFEGVLASMEEVAAQLAQADLSGIAEDISLLVESSQTGLEEALRKLNSIDLDTLNKAISDFSDIIEPLARFF